MTPLHNRQTQQQMASPEWRTQQLVIAAKRRQAEAWQSRLDGPGLNDATRRHCLANVNALRRVIGADEAATRALADAAARCLQIALLNYGRALKAGGAHDLEAVYRLCQLWLSLPDDAAVNARVSEAAEAAPSAKFVPLAYQIASRMSARGAAGQLGESQRRFQRVRGLGACCRCLRRCYRGVGCVCADETTATPRR